MALNTGTYNITPGESQKEQDWRRKMAYELWKEGMDAQNIRHPMQGVANLAKAAMGGYELYKADESDRNREKSIAAALNNLPGMGGGEAPDVSPDGKAMATALRGNPGVSPTGPSSGANYMTGALPGADAITGVSTPGGINVQVHKDAAPHFQGFLTDMEAAGAPIKGVGGYNQRKIAGTDRWSQHAYGNAIDIDQTGRNATAEALRQWGTQNPDKLAELEKKYGMVGGQNFSKPDWGHWEWSGRNGGLTPPAAREANIGPPMPNVAPSQVVPTARPAPADPAQVPIGTTLPPPDVPPMPPAAAMPPQATPAAPAGPAAAPAASPPPQVRSPQLTPAQQAEIKMLWMDPATRPLAQAKYQEYSKPKEQWVQKKTPEGIHYDENQLTGERKWAPPQQNISVNSVADPVLKGVGEQIIKSREAANSAASDIIPAIHETRKALDQGAITGIAADPRLLISKIGNLIGLEGPEASNTEIVASTLGKQVLDHAKALGANPSNADRDYIAKVMGGKITLEEKSIRRLLDMQEKYARQAIKQFNGDAQKLMSGNPDTYKQIAPLMSVTEPDEYKPAAPEPGAKKLRYNIQTRQWE